MKKLVWILPVLFVIYIQNYEYMDVDMSTYEKNNITVEIKGEVENPGSYTLSKDSTYNDLIEESGGLLEDADISSININTYLMDNDVLVIGKVEEVSKVSINSASLEELETLPGVGPATAQKIIDYRESNGTFQSLEDLMNVSGIKEKTYEKLKDSICL